MDGPAYTKFNEGCRLTAYRDSLGVWTIGYGCTGPGIGPGVVWEQGHADAAFSASYGFAAAQAKQDVGEVWDSIGEIRQAALTDMAYQLGGTGLAKFVKMILAIRNLAWNTAATQVLLSEYDKETPRRCERTSYMLRMGLWPKEVLA